MTLSGHALTLALLYILSIILLFILRFGLGGFLVGIWVVTIPLR